MLVRAAIECRDPCLIRSLRFSTSRIQVQNQGLRTERRHESIQRDASSSSTSLVTSRERVGALYESLNNAIDGNKYHVEILGSYRREMGRIDAIPILVTGISDGRTPASSRETYKKETQIVVDRLTSEGILASVNPLESDVRSFACSQCPGLSITLQYVPKACHGAARLYLTGDDSYIRFLRLLSMEGMCLNLNMLGLWKVPNIQSLRSNSSQSASQKHTIPQRLAIEKIPINQESEGDRRMRTTRRAMGLPEGLDLSLDLETSLSARDLEHFNVDALSQQEVEADLIRKADEGTYSERFTAGSGSEAEILDLLGLVWIPPSLRSVKGL